MGGYVGMALLLAGVLWLIAGFFWRNRLYGRIQTAWSKAKGSGKPDMETAMDTNTLGVDISQSYRNCWCSGFLAIVGALVMFW